MDFATSKLTKHERITFFVCPSAPQAKFFSILRCRNTILAFKMVFSIVFYTGNPQNFPAFGRIMN